MFLEEEAHKNYNMALGRGAPVASGILKSSQVILMCSQDWKQWFKGYPRGFLRFSISTWPPNTLPKICFIKIEINLNL